MRVFLVNFYVLRRFAIGCFAVCYLFMAFSPQFSVQADLNLSKWEWRAKIVGTTTSSVATLELLPDALTGLAPDLADLRIADTDGVEAPYVLVATQGNAAALAVASEPEDMHIENTATVFTIRIAKPGMEHNSFTLATRSRNFIRAIQIYGSTDNDNWQPLNVRGRIYDYTAAGETPLSVRSTRVDYPAVTFPYLLVRVLNAGEPPLDIQGADLAYRPPRSGRNVTYQATFEARVDAPTQSRDLVVDLGSANLPHRAVRVETESRNFKRAIAIYTSDDKAAWQRIGNAYIYSIKNNDMETENLAFEYPVSSSRYLKLSIVTDNAETIRVTGVSVFGEITAVAFPSDTGKTYYAYFGNSAAKRPAYRVDGVSQIVMALPQDMLALEAPEKNPFFVPESGEIPLYARAPYAVPVTVAVFALAGFFVILKLLHNRRAE